MKLKRKVTHKAVLLAGFFLFLSTCLVGTTWAAGNRFETLEDGTVKDSKTGLIWAAKDNGAAIMWSKAVEYCKNYSEGGHNDWRVPTSSELATLYGGSPKTSNEPASSYGSSRKAKGQDSEKAIDVITDLIHISAPLVWTARRTSKNKAFAFSFSYGTSRRLHRGGGENRRALPVRSATP
jgi:uncharacterized protein DUF1566